MVEHIITGLDVGSSNIRIVVGQLARTGDTEQLNIIGVVEVPAMGVNKGMVVSIEDAVSSISSALEKAERMIGLPIENAWVGIGGTHVNSQESNGVIAISRANGEIQESDVARVLEAARSVAAPVNYEVLHVIPKTFSIDNQTGIKDPLGMSGIRLEVSTQVIRGLTSQIKNLTRGVYRTGIDINDVVFSILAAAEAVLSVRQKELGVGLVDVGAKTTKVLVFEEGDLIHAAVIPIGADHITGDIALCLQTSLDVAERVKLEVGNANLDAVEKDKDINLRDFGGDDQVFSKKFVSEVIEARVEELFKLVDQELQKINRSGLLPAGLVLIGGGAKLPGMVEVGKKKTMLPVSLGISRKFNTAVDKVSDMSFATALGLVMWGYNVLNESRATSGGFGNSMKNVREVGDKVKGWFKNLIN
jgi:cell division protein FtsA